MILYHAARDEATAEATFAHGFTDARGYDSADRWWKGVWLFDRPVGVELLIRVDVPGEVAERYEWVQQNTPYREWLIPADILNRYPRARVSDRSED